MDGWQIYGVGNMFVLKFCWFVDINDYIIFLLLSLEGFLIINDLGYYVYFFFVQEIKISYCFYLKDMINFFIKQMSGKKERQVVYIIVFLRFVLVVVFGWVLKVRVCVFICIVVLVVNEFVEVKMGVGRSKNLDIFG